MTARLTPDEFETCVWGELRQLGADRHPAAAAAVAVIVAMAALMAAVPTLPADDPETTRRRRDALVRAAW